MAELQKAVARGSVRELFTRDFLLIATINFAMFFAFQMTTIGIPVYMASLGAEAQIVGLVTSFITISATVVRVFAGALLDRFGRKGALIGGTAIIACSVISYAVFPIIGVILCLRLLQGIGWGMGTTASSTIAADVIPKHRFAEGMGYFAMTQAISGALAPAVALELAGHSGSLVMLLVAAGMSVLAFVLAFFQSGGLKREEAAAEASASASKQGAAAAAVPARGFAAKLDTVFERTAVVPGILIMLVNIGFGSVVTFVALHAADQGIPSASLYFFVYSITCVISRPVIGKAIDRRGFRMPSILSTLGAAATLVIIGLSTNMAMLSCAGVFAGLGVGTATGVFNTMAVARVGRERHGVAMSTFLVLFDLGIAFGAFIAGVIANAVGYASMYLIISVFPLIACLISALTIKGGQADYAKPQAGRQVK